MSAVGISGTDVAAAPPIYAPTQWCGRELVGVVHGLPHAAYLAAEGLSVSRMRAAQKSPFHLQAHVGSEPTEPQALGTLTHCLTLEPDAFDTRYAVGPDVSRATKEWKGWAEATLAGRIGLKPADVEPARQMARSVRAVPEVANLLAQGEAEVSYFWREPVVLADGTVHMITCKARADWGHRQANPTTGRHHAILMDLKTTTDASPKAFARSCATYGYHLQAAHYMRGWRAATGEDVLGFVFAVVESEPPYAAAAYMLDEDSIALGEAKCEALRQVAATCERNHHWPGYASEGLQVLRLPAWAFLET
jgi:hypothetical protein